MAQLLYKLWMADQVLGSWDTPHEMREGVSDYIEVHPEEVHLLRVTGFALSSSKPAKPVFVLQGQELVSYLEDLESGD